MERRLQVPVAVVALQVEEERRVEAEEEEVRGRRALFRVSS